MARFPGHARRLGADGRSAGLDLAIGERDITGRGWGPLVLREFAQHHIFRDAAVDAIIADPSAANLASVSAFQKAGFRVTATVRLPDEDFERLVVRLDRREVPAKGR